MRAMPRVPGCKVTRGDLDEISRLIEEARKKALQVSERGWRRTFAVQRLTAYLRRGPDGAVPASFLVASRPEVESSARDV